jgi:hypothetical protein
MRYFLVAMMSGLAPTLVGANDARAGAPKPVRKRHRRD